jgi:thiosulfate reductase cytochrome b subunit
MKLIEKHALPLRLVHWLNVPLLALMVWSGWMIEWANNVHLLPESFFEKLGLTQRLAEGLSIHFTIAWLFIINGTIYLFWFFLSGHWREIFPTKQTLRDAVPTILHDLGLSESAPPQGKFNAMQRIAYTSVILMALIAVLSGFAIYKPVQLGWLIKVFGGYEGARLMHFVMMFGFCAFVAVHVLQVLRAGWNGFRAMVAGFEVEE